MLIPNGSGFIAGQADIAIILKVKDRFYVTIYEEKPMPGPIQPINELEFIRLKSKMSHTVGGATLKEAQKHLEEIREKIQFSDNNVISDRSFEAEDTVGQLNLPNWVKEGKSLSAIME